MKLDDAIATYIKLRDRKAEMVAKLKADSAKIDEALLKIEAALLKVFEKTGQDSTKGATGTAYITRKSTDKVVDREAFLAFVLEEKAYDFLESRANKTALDAFIEESDGDLPPGVTRSTVRKVNVRKPSNG